MSKSIHTVNGIKGTEENNNVKNARRYEFPIKIFVVVVYTVAVK